MKFLKVVIGIFGVIFIVSVSFAQYDHNSDPKKDNDVPEGMEVIQVTGGYKLIVPKGAKIKKIGAQIIVEGTREYMSRRFTDMENRLAKLEKAQDDLKTAVTADQETWSRRLQELEDHLGKLQQVLEALQQELNQIRPAAQ